MPIRPLLRHLLTVCMAFGLAAKEARPDPAVLEAFAAREQKSAELVLPYRFMAPSRIEAGKRYPLILFFYGSGARGDNNLSQLAGAHRSFIERMVALREQYPCFVIAPQCPKERRWVEVDWGEPSHQMPTDPSPQLRLSLEAADLALREHPIDPDRVYVTGLSMGGFATFDLITRYPERFAAAIPVCGGADDQRIGIAARLPIWVFHGALDKVVPVARSRNAVAALKRAGGTPRYTEVPDADHFVWGPAYGTEGLFPWLFTQVRRPIGSATGGKIH